MRVAVCAKQVPRLEGWGLGADGRLLRAGLAVEMNAFCRRAVAQGIAIARASAGSCTVVTLGPPSAELVAREAVACGADRGVVVSDPQLAGSDTLATSRALAAALRRTGPYDIVLVGRSSIDADTAQVGPSIAEALGWPFAGPARQLEIRGDRLRLHAELDDGDAEMEIALPCVVSAAERLIGPAKADAAAMAAVDPRAILQLTAADLGAGAFGAAGSPTAVLRVVDHAMERTGMRLAGSPPGQVAELVARLAARGALPWSAAPPDPRPARPPLGAVPASGAPPGGAGVVALLEPGHERVARELLAGAARLAAELGGHVVALEVVAPNQGVPGWTPAQLGSWGADRVVRLAGSLLADDLVESVAAQLVPPTGVALAPSTDWGREVAARVAARQGFGLTGDAVDVSATPEGVIGWKPALGGRFLAAIGSRSEVVMATVRPGAWRVGGLRTGAPPPTTQVAVIPRGRVVQANRHWDDVPARIQAASTLVGVGAGVPTAIYPELDTLCGLLGAELVATRRVTDLGWLPRSRQVGLTGHGVAPRLYLALGISGSSNHLVGVAAAGWVVAVNCDPAAPVFAMADLGIVGDAAEVARHLTRALAAHREESGSDPAPAAGVGG
ncbi:MAG TPA: FAD-binding protein [Verrucomicrobiae bacterium]|nr:FAD-binding protein [Verrucomicrobiae bacterium]